MASLDFNTVHNGLVFLAAPASVLVVQQELAGAGGGEHVAQRLWTGRLPV